MITLVALGLTGQLSVKASASAGVEKTDDDPQRKVPCDPTYWSNCDKSVTPTGSTQDELNADYIEKCNNACAPPAPAPAPTRAPLAITHQMDKETFYQVMGWEADTVHPWQRWGLVGPQITPPAGADLLPYIIVLLVFVILGILAAKRSWAYNSRMAYTGETGVFIDQVTGKQVTLPVGKPVNSFAKYFYAVVAFYFGPIYLLLDAVSGRESFFKLLQARRLIPSLQDFGASVFPNELE